MTKTKVGVLSALCAAVVLSLVVVVLVVVLKGLDGIGRQELLEECDYDATLSGLQGYCVVVSRYPATPVHSERTYLEIAAVHDGAPLDHRFRALYPFATRDAGEDLTVDWSQVGVEITVTDPASGSSITYPADEYAGGR